MRLARFFWKVGPALLWMGLIFSFSTDAGSAGHTNPFADRFLLAFFPDLARRLSPVQLDWLHFYVRKAAHLTEYAVLALLLARALRFGRRALPLPRLLARAWLLATLYAVTDELHQRWIPSRTPKAGDVLIDSAGALVGLGLLALFRRRRG